MKENDIFMNGTIDNKTFSFIGCGNMAQAIIRGLDITGIPHKNIWLNDKYTAQYSLFADDYNIAETAADAAEHADYIFLCVKPQNYIEPLEVIRESGITLEGKTVISIVTGISCGKISLALGAPKTAIIRTMPNTPMLIGMGVTAVCRSAYVTDTAYSDICSLLDTIGSTLDVSEDKMCDIIAETSSSPAYVYLFIKSICDKAVSYGFDRSMILNAVCDTVIGSASLLRDGGISAEEQIARVTSKGGTTERAMKVFADREFEKIIGEAMDACTERAYELSGEKK